MQLIRGQRVKLKDYIDINQDIQVRLHTEGNALYDTCCISLDASERISDENYVIFYNQETSPDSEITYRHDDADNYSVALSRLPEIITRLVFAVCIDDADSAGEIISHKIEITQNGIVVFQVILNGSEFTDTKTLIGIEIYKKEVWRLAVVAGGYKFGMGELLESYGGSVVREEQSAGSADTVSADDFSSDSDSAAENNTDFQDSVIEIKDESHAVLNDKSESYDEADIPFGEFSQPAVIERAELTHTIPVVLQENEDEDDEDDLPFGMPAKEQEDMQEASSKKDNSVLSESISVKRLNENSTIAPDFTVFDEVILHVKSEITINDAPIDKLGLSPRSYNSLRRAGISMISELVSLRIYELKNIRNLGLHLQNEVLEVLNRYLKKIVYGGSRLTSGRKNDFTDITEEDEDLVNLNPPIENLPLSVRAKNCLQRNGISDLKSLLETDTDTFSSFKNLGLKTLVEIIAYKDKHKSDLSLILENGQENSARLFARKAEIEQRRIKEENFDTLKNILFNIFYTHPLFSYSCDRLHQIAEGYEGIEMLDDVIAELLEENIIRCCDNKNYRLVCVPLWEFINNELNANEPEKEILQKRINGKTLEEIAESMGVTRERIRQHQSRFLNLINKKCSIHKIILHEEAFRYLFENYDISKELFCEITKEPVQTYRYLSISGKSGSKSLEQLMSDEKIPVFIKSGWENYLRFSPQSPYVYLNDGTNRRVRKERSEIEKYILSEYCTDEVSFEEFAELYNDFLNANHLSDEKKLQFTEAETRTRENYFSKCKDVLWKSGKKLRYYPILSQDYTQLFEVLQLGQYQNIEISTLKLFRQHSDTMEQYDIRDEYELHNLLKKIGIEHENNTAEFERTPYILFGKFDREKMIKEKLFEYAPVSGEKLAELISEEYGFLPAQIKIWFDCIKEYFRNGMFSVDYVPMSDEHMKLLKTELTEDFYYIKEIREIYRRIVPDADESLISSFNLTRMGFQVNSDYAVQNYLSAAKYFEHLLTANDIVHTLPFSGRYSNTEQYYVVLKKLRNTLQIIEYEPHNYIHISRLNRLNVTETELRQYCTDVFNHAEEDSYFTVESIRKNGFVSELDRLGFEPRFYASVLRTDNRFQSNELGGTVLFYKGDVKPELKTFLVNMISRMESAVLDDFLELAEEKFGMKLDRDRVKYAVSDTGLYYDSIMGTIYRDYDTYYRMISGIDDE